MTPRIRLTRLNSWKNKPAVLVLWAVVSGRTAFAQEEVERTTCEGRASVACEPEEASVHEICVLERTVACKLESGDELTKGRFWQEAATFYEDAGEKLKAAALRTPDNLAAVKLSRFRLHVEALIRAIEIRIDWSTEQARFATAAGRLDKILREVEDVRAKQGSVSESAELAELVVRAGELRRRAHVIGAETRGRDARVLSEQGNVEAASIATKEAAGHHLWLADHEPVPSVAENHLIEYVRTSHVRIRLVESSKNLRRDLCATLSEVSLVLQEYAARRGEFQRAELRTGMRRLQMEADLCRATTSFDKAALLTSEEQEGSRRMTLRELDGAAAGFDNAAKLYDQLVRSHGTSSAMGELELTGDDVAGWVARSREASERASNYLRLRRHRATAEGQQLRCRFNTLLRDVSTINPRISGELAKVKPLGAEREPLILPGAVLLGTGVLFGAMSAGLWGSALSSCPPGESEFGCARPRAISSLVTAGVGSVAGLTGAILLSVGLVRQKRRATQLRGCFALGVTVVRTGVSAQFGCRF